MPLRFLRLWGMVRLVARRIPPVSPLLLAAYPATSLFSLNIDQLWPGALVRPLLEGVGWAALAYGVIAGVFRSFLKGALLTSVLVLFYFFFGYGVDLLVLAGGARTEPFMKYFFLSLGTLAIGALAAWLWRHPPPERTNRVLDFTAALWLFFPVLGIAAHQATRQKWIPPAATVSLGSADIVGRPDIFFILLDAYAREDVLTNLFHFDNGSFLRELRYRGFQIADQSKSNYSITFLSLAATLNMRYLDDVVRENNRGSVARDLPGEMIQNNAVQSLLKRGGYQIVHLPSGWAVTDHNPGADVVMGKSSLHEFRAILFRPTIPGTLFAKSSQRGWREIIFSNLEALERCQSMSGPKFVFAHFVCPHEPFVFYPDGGDPRPDFAKESYRKRWTKRRRYLDNLEFISRRILIAIDRIVEESKTDPIIILQSDHGPSTLTFSPRPSTAQIHERMSNLCALRLPGKRPPKLPVDFTPVNTFPFIFDTYFGTRFGQRKNRSYYCDPATPYAHIDVSTCCRTDENPFKNIPAPKTIAFSGAPDPKGRD